MVRRVALLIVATLAVLGPLVACGGGATAKGVGVAPSFPSAPVILISIDTLRADAVSGFGAPAAQTPHLAAIGDEGIRFERAIAASHITAPSHASMLTGFSCFVHGVAMGGQGKSWSIPAEIPTLAELLKWAGYRTAGFTDGIQLLPEGGFGRGFDVYDPLTLGLEMKLRRMIAFVQSSGDSPYFLFAHTYRPHQPYRAPQDLVDELLAGYDGVYAEPAREASALTHHAVMTSSPVQNRITKALSGSRAKTDADRLFFRKLYDAGVVGADREVGALLKGLREVGALDRAIVIITSDHGEEFFEHGHDSHHTVFDEVIRVPLIIRLPKALGAGRRIETPVSSISLVPTILELTGVPPRIVHEGESIASSLLEGEPEARPVSAAWWTAISRFPGGRATRTRNLKQIDLIDGQSSLAFYKFGKLTVFDLSADPDETKASAGAHPAEQRLIDEYLAEMRELWPRMRLRHRVESAGAAELSAEQIEALRAVGYTR
ncbi:MAG: sulfatase [Planctomycetes bacterium]|nr:sulfatase [Planctomycetota bacterium]